MSTDLIDNPAVRQMLAKVLTDPKSAADDLEAMASKMLAAARDLRSLAAEQWRSTGGMGDSCSINVVGSDGQIKQTGGTQ